MYLISIVTINKLSWKKRKLKLLKIIEVIEIIIFVQNEDSHLEDLALDTSSRCLCLHTSG